MKLQLARLIKNICYAAGCASAVLSLALKSAPQTAQRWLLFGGIAPAGAGLPCQRDVLPLPALPPGTACQPRENGRLPVLQAPSAGYEMTARITIPPQVQALLRQLNAAGFSAYAVGGCVRDSLLGCAPQDWDICTSAAPEQTEACFAADRTILTGARYGTVTVVRGACPTRSQRSALRLLCRQPPSGPGRLSARAGTRSGAPRFYGQRHGGRRSGRRDRPLRRAGRPAPRRDPLRWRSGGALCGGRPADAARTAFLRRGCPSASTERRLPPSMLPGPGCAPLRRSACTRSLAVFCAAGRLLRCWRNSPMCCSSSSRSLPPVRASGSIIRIIRAMSGHTRWPLWTAFRPRSRSGWRLCCTMPESQRHFSSIKISSAISTATRPPGPPSREEVLRRLRYDRATTEFVTQLVAVHGLTYSG